MRVLVLGPLTVVDGGEHHRIESTRARALLATLAIRAGSPVPVSELVDAVWGDDPPRSAEKILQGQVSDLRKRFGDGIVATVPGGYQLGEGVDSVDVEEFESGVRTGRELLAEGDAGRAALVLTRTLALWRGTPLADLDDGTAHAGRRARLDELRLLAVEGRLEAELELGHHRDVVPDLDGLVAEHPFREHLWRLLMVALYRSGRAGDALDACRRLRTVLRDELGIDPAEETRSLELRILDHDPSLDLVPTPMGNLAAPLDAFVDREEERTHLRLALDEQRLVTLVGVGGVGKSRLALETVRELAADVPGGVWWIDLAAMVGTGSVVGRVLAAMGLSASTPGASRQVLLTRLHRDPTLLVLDNCEHQRSAVADFVGWVTSHDQRVRVLATSRQPLGVGGERRLTVAPLDLDDARGPSASAQLFLQRVTDLGGPGPDDSGDVESVVRAVGGLPLGIELAAAQCGVRTPRQIATALGGTQELLALSTPGRPDDRHGSLGRVLDATVDAVSPDLVDVAPRLAIFPGDFGLPAAGAALGVGEEEAASIMVRLVDASLVTVASRSRDSNRFRLLWPVRELLHERAAPGELDRAATRCAEHFTEIGRRFLEEADTPAETAWLAHAREDEHNFALALTWSEHDDPTTALALAPGLARVWQYFDDQVEGRDTVRRLLDRAPDAPDRLVAATELELCFLELLSGDLDAATRRHDDVIRRFEAVGDARWLSRALRLQAHALHIGGFPPTATTPLYERSIAVAEQAGLPYSQALTEVHFAHASGAYDDLDRVDHLLDHAEVVLRRHHDHGALAHAALGRAFAAFGRDEAEACRRHGAEMLRQARLAEHTIWMQVASVVLGVAWFELDDVGRSRQYLDDAVHLAHDTANVVQLGIALHALAATLGSSHPTDAARLWGAAGARTPLWPLHARRYGEWIATARTRLGAERFDREVAIGARLSGDEVVRTADEHTRPAGS